MTLRIGTRGSALAQAQARIVADALGLPYELRIVRTAGDVSDRPIAELGEGAFVAAIEAALRRDDVDLAVHSLKDLPTAEPDGLVIAAVLERDDPRDVLLTRERGGLASLPRGGVIGTSSPRRAAFLRALRPDTSTRDIRGNVDTRMRKLQTGEYDGVVLALAGLRRLGVAVGEREILDPRDCPPAPGQGALAVQCRAADRATIAAVAALDHAPTRRATDAERALLRTLGGSCELPFGAWARIEDGEVALDAALVTAQGIVRTRVRGPRAAEVAVRAADALRSARVA